MKQVSGKALVKILIAHDWTVDRIKGSHHIMVREGKEIILTVPVHGNQPLKIGLLRALMKQDDLTEKDL